jgi:ADP-heptose:LPS heptosyltransferase
MHLLTIPKGITESVPVYYGRPLEEGVTYLCSNAFAGNMLQSRWRVVINEEMWALSMLLKAHHYPDRPFDITASDIFLIRGGGFGDLLLFTPLVRAIKAKNPDCTVHIVCGSQYHSMFEGIDVIPELLPLPIEDVHKKCVVSYDEWIEGHPRAEKVHMAQHFASKCGITLTDLKPEYHISAEERAWANETYPRTLPRIGVQFMASTFTRSYPKMEAVVRELAGKTEVFLFGMPGQIELMKPIAHVTNLSADKLTFRQSAAVLSTCDACIAPDSVLVHLCSALDIPCVGIYASFPSELRVTSPLNRALNGRAVPCAPCFFHCSDPTEFPHGMPCSEAGRCVAFDSITPEMVVEETLDIIFPRPAREGPAPVFSFKPNAVQGRVPL